MGWFPCCCGGEPQCELDNTHCSNGGKITCCLILELSGVTTFDCSDCDNLNGTYVVKPPTGTFGTPFTQTTYFAGSDQCGFSYVTVETSVSFGTYYLDVKFFSGSEYIRYRYTSGSALTCKTWTDLTVPYDSTNGSKCDATSSTLTITSGTFCECSKCCEEGELPDELTVDIPSGGYCLDGDTFILSNFEATCVIDFDNNDPNYDLVASPSYSTCCYEYSDGACVGCGFGCGSITGLRIYAAFEFNDLSECRLVVIFSFYNCGTLSHEFKIGYRSDWESAPHNCASRSWTCNEFKNSGSYSCSPTGTITVTS